MTDLGDLKQVWREPHGAREMHAIGKEELMALIQARMADIRQRTMARVRTESYNYVVLVAIPVVMLFASRGFTLRAVLASLGVLAALGPILGALAYKEYRLRTLPLGDSLRQSLAALVTAIDSTSRFYMVSYMTCVIVGVASVDGFLVWRYGVSWIPAATLVFSIVFLVWAYRSGQAYVRRMFGDDRAEVMQCLGELEGA
jgi:hypothetical protein